MREEHRRRVLGDPTLPVIVERQVEAA